MQSFRQKRPVIHLGEQVKQGYNRQTLSINSISNYTCNPNATPTTADVMRVNANVNCKTNYSTTYSYANFSKDFFWHPSSFFQNLVQGSTILQRHVTPLYSEIPFQKNMNHQCSSTRQSSCLQPSFLTMCSIQMLISPSL